MKILILDRDRNAMQFLQNCLEEDGHSVVVESIRKDALERVAQEEFDVIAIDPAPLPSARQITLPLRWERHDYYSYMLLLGHNSEDQEVIHSGMNDKILKPFDPADIRRKLDHAKRLTEFMKRLGAGQQVASDRQIFGQRAFYQLVLSALDRAARYNEQAFLLVMRLDNFAVLEKEMGPEKANDVQQALGDYLSSLHRMSDFLGHSDKTEYVLLILRPSADTEPHDAAERFTVALREFQARYESGTRPEFTLELWMLPSAILAAQAKLGNNKKTEDFS
ncbi:MAG: response regulator [Alphaproteobacteria bacterium]|nr:response regulator [Alphaproteobacteria bacterium]